MKKILMCLLLTTGFLAAESDEMIELSAPTSYIDFDQLDRSIERWKQEVTLTLNEQEIQLVAHCIKLGSLSSLIDLRARQAVRSLLPLVWQMQEEIVAGKQGFPLLKQIEERSEKLHQLMVYHDMMLKQWNDWTNAVDVSENVRVKDALDTVYEQIKQAVKQCLSSYDWQKIAVSIPEILDQNMKAGNMLRALCSSINVSEAGEGSQSEEGVHDEVSAEQGLEQPLIYFSWLTNAADIFNTRSWESIESASQLLMYQEELLTISGVIYNKYLRVINAEEAAAQESLLFA